MRRLYFYRRVLSDYCLRVFSYDFGEIWMNLNLFRGENAFNIHPEVGCEAKVEGNNNKLAQSFCDYF